MENTQRINILGVNFDNLTMYECIEKCNNFFNSNVFNSVVTPNPEIIMATREDESFKRLINSSQLIIPDGIGVIIASKILHTKLKERVPGFDLINNLLKDEKIEKNIYLLGAKPGIAETAKIKIEEKYNVKIVGTHDGYYKPEEEGSIVNDIKKSNANVLLVGMGMKKQEQFIENHRNEMENIRIAIGCGGSLDVFAGTLKRAPIVFQKLGLEWLYRLIKQPSRFRRMLVLPKFILITMFKGKKESK